MEFWVKVDICWNNCLKFLLHGYLFGYSWCEGKVNFFFLRNKGKVNLVTFLGFLLLFFFWNENLILIEEVNIYYLLRNRIWRLIHREHGKRFGGFGPWLLRYDEKSLQKSSPKRKEDFWKKSYFKRWEDS